MRLARTFMAAAAIAACLVGSAEASPPSGGAAIVRGQGMIRRDGSAEWRPTSTADVLTVGVAVQTGDTPLEMILPDGVTIRLEPNSHARWAAGGKLPSETNHYVHGYHLLLLEGELEVRMPPAPKGSHAFLVSSLAGTLTDWRGQLHVRVHGDSTAAAIYEGALVVGSNGHGFPVYDGAGILMKRGINPDKSRGVPATPTWSGGAGLALAAPEAAAQTEVAWSAVPRATEYRVEVALDPTMVRVVDRQTTTEPRASVACPAAVDTVWVHARAVDAGGIVGEWSAARPVRVARYTLPEGAVVGRDGAVVLPRGARVSIADPAAGSPDSLEVAYEDVVDTSRRVDVPLYWAKLPGAVQLSEDAPVRIVHLREPNGGGEARLVLAQRSLEARVAMTPSNARWPLDPIEARVDVRDPSGRIDASREAVTVETLLDITPLRVQWTREGTTWLARIAPRYIGDPSVVRVVVRDGQGSEIGRGFVELAPVATK